MNCQQIPSCCQCGNWMAMANVIRIDDYPDGFRKELNPNSRALVFECPLCFELSCCHADEILLESYELAQIEEKENK